MAQLLQSVIGSITGLTTGTLSISTVAGSELVLIAAINEFTSANNLSSVSDSAGNVWSRVTTVQTSGSPSTTGDITLDVWHTSNALAAVAVTAVSASSMETCALTVLEFSGISASNPIDVVTTTTSSNTTFSPSVTPTAPNDFILYIAGSGVSNLLTANESSMETDATGWTAGANTTRTQDAAHALDGTKALKLVSTASGNVTVNSARNIPVTAGQTYLASYWAFTTLTGRVANYELDWRTAGGTFVGFTDLPAQGLPKVTLVANTWTQVSFTVVVPTGAAISTVTLLPIITSQGAAESYWIDGIVQSPTSLSHIADTSTTPVAQVGVASPNFYTINGGTSLLVYGTFTSPQTTSAHSTTFSKSDSPKAGVALALNTGSNNVVVGPGPAGLNSSWQLQYNGLTVGTGSSYGLKDVTGIREIPPMRVIDDPQAMADGTFIAPDFLGGRTVQANLIVSGATDAALATNLQTLENAFIAYTGTTTELPLYWQLPNGYQRRVWARLRKRTTPTDKMYQLRAASMAVEFYCSDPRLYDAFDTTTTLSPSVASAGRSYNRTFNFTYGAGSNPSSVNLVNAGNTTTYPMFTMYGPLTNPLISNNTYGQYLWFNMTMNVGDTFVVDCKNKTALLNGVSVRGSMIQGSAWTTLAPGTNNIQFTPGSGTGQCSITYRSAWL